MGDKSCSPTAAFRFAPPQRWEITLGCPPATSPVALGGRGEDAAVGRREPLALPDPLVMWLLTAQGRNGSWLTAR